MPFRVSYFLTLQCDLLAGWSFSLWSNYNDATALIPVVNAMQYAVQQATGNGVNVVHARISNVSQFRAVQILNYVQTGVPTGGSNDGDFAATGVLLRLKASPSYETRQLFRGVMDGSVNTGGRWLPTANQASKINQVIGLLTNASNGWCLRKIDRTTPIQLLLAITSSGVCNVPSHGYVTGDRVRISRAKGTFIINKIWTIVKIDNDNFQLSGFVTPTPTPIYLGGGKVQKQVYGYFPINGVDQLRASKRNPGRPFGQFTGRRRHKTA